LAAKGLRSQPKPPLAAGGAAVAGSGNGAGAAMACSVVAIAAGGAGGTSGTAGVAGAAAAGCAGVGAGFFLKKLNIVRYLESLHSMKRAFTLLGLLACLSAGAQTPACTTLSAPSCANPSAVLPAQAATASGAQQFTLSNGMQLIVQPDRRAPTAMHMVWLRVGSMDEVDGTSGVAHVLEHMMFNGSKTGPPGEFSRRVAALGGQENAFTSRDYTGYYQQIPANRLEDVMRLEADRFAHNQWPDAEFRKEIEVVKEERRLRTEDQPRAVLAEQLFATTYVASPYRRPVVGWMSDLDAMTPDDVRNFHRRWYVPGNAAVVVAGDVDVAQVRTLAEKYYGRLPARAVPARKPRTEPAQQGLRRVAVKAPAEQAYVALAFRVPSMERVDALTDGDSDALALMVLSAVLSGYDGARLERALSQGPQRVADSAGSSAMVMGRGPSLFLLSGVPAEGKTAQQVEDALRAEVARVAREGVSEAELSRVKTQWIASTVYQRDSVHGQAQDLGSNWVQGLPLDAEERLLALLRTVTPEQVQQVAARYFGDDQLTVATLLPQPLDAKPRRAAPADGATRH
jgi:zinc protease